MEKHDKILEKLGYLDTEWKKAQDAVGSQIKEHGAALSDTREKLEAIEKEMGQLESALDKALEERSLPLRDGQRVSAEQVEYERAFESWLRDPTNGQKQMHLKAVQTTTDPAGGYAVPEEISRSIGAKLLDLSPLRSLVRVVSIGTSDYKELLDDNGQSSGWVGETGTRSETNTPILQQVVPTMGTLYAYPKATEESLDDVFFDVQSWLTNSVAKEFAYQEGEAFTTGNGTNKPTGFLNGTPSATVDDGASPVRPFGTLQYLPTGAAAGFTAGPLGSPISYDQADVFIDAEYALKPAYRSNAVWVMNKNTLKTVRKFKDADGDYLWSRSMIAGQPSTLNGYPVYEMESMPAIAANAFPVAFGDFREGYLAVDRVGLRMTVDNITTPGYVKFYVRRRQGGIIYNDDAIKLIKCATS